MRRKHRAIALIATMVAAVAVAMVITAALMLVPGQLDNSVHTRERELAQQAALSGLEYALNRLRSDPQWKGLDNRTVVDTPSLKIVEDLGNVIGTLKAADGSLSQFTIRFNYQNGGPTAASGADDGLPDPSALNVLSNANISIHNLEGTAAVDQLRENGGRLTSVGIVAPLSGVLWVEGSAGQGLGQPGSNRRVVRVNLENWVGADTSKLPDAGLYGPQKILARISGIPSTSSSSGVQGALQVKSSISTAKAKVRGLEGVEVTAPGPKPYLTDAGGQVVVGTGKRFTVNGGDSSLPTATQESASSQKARWPKMKWSEVPKAISTDTNIRAGTYVWNNSGGLDYYKKDYAGSLPSGTPDASITSGSDMISSGSGTITLSQADKLTRFAGRFYVQPQGSVKSFTVMADPDLEANGRRPTLYFDRTSSRSSMLSGSADINLLGATRGSGSISSEGNLTLQGDSIFEVALQDGVALYTKKDLILKEIPPKVSTKIEQTLRSTNDYIPPLDPPALPSSLSSTGTDLNGRMSILAGSTIVQAFSPVFFRDIEPTTLLTPKDIALQGVLYAQGGIQAKMPSGGSLFVRGVVIAYGGDPETQDPASSGGLVELEANSATVLYDPSYYQAMLSKLGPREIVTSARYFH